MVGYTRWCWWQRGGVRVGCVALPNPPVTGVHNATVRERQQSTINAIFDGGPPSLETDSAAADRARDFSAATPSRSLHEPARMLAWRSDDISNERPRTVPTPARSIPVSLRHNASMHHDAVGISPMAL